MSDLVKRLRDASHQTKLIYAGRTYEARLMSEAADRIEVLERQNSDLQANNTKLVLEMRELRISVVDLMTAVLAAVSILSRGIQVSAGCSPDYVAVVSTLTTYMMNVIGSLRAATGDKTVTVVRNEGKTRAAAPKGENTPFVLPQPTKARPEFCGYREWKRLYEEEKHHDT